MRTPACDAPLESPPDRSPRDETFARWLGAGAAMGGVVCAWVFHRAGLTLSHYDAKAHLVVARRIIDSVTPGWQQIGAVWLPLPHVLNALPVQVDAWYRSGASGVALSIAGFALAAYAVARLVLRATGSRLGAAIGAIVLATNPNLLYLQSTPMTEPLLLGFALLGVALTFEWVDGAATSWPRGAGWALAAACLTRYEAWPVTVAAIAAAGYALVRRGMPVDVAIRRLATLAVGPAIALAAFVAISRVTIGEWFVSGGFFVPDNPVMGRPIRSAGAVWWGTHELSGYGIATLAACAAIALLATAIASPRRAGLAVLLAPIAAAALPWYAFFEGHPFRVRYMVPLVGAAAVSAGAGVGLTPKHSRWLAALALASLIALETKPVDFDAPMAAEARWDQANAAGRHDVTRCLTAGYRGETIMASMGSLAHYMQELSHEGLALREFLHEGNGGIWLDALAHGPAPHVGWVLIEEQAEGGDMLAAITRRDPRWLHGFTRVCAGGGVALHKRTPESRPL